MSVLPVFAAVLGAIGLSLIVLGGGATAVALLALLGSWRRASRAASQPLSPPKPGRVPRRFEPRPVFPAPGREATAATRETELLYVGRLGRDDQSLLPTVWMGREVLAFALEADAAASSAEASGVVAAR